MGRRRSNRIASLQRGAEIIHLTPRPSREALRQETSTHPELKASRRSTHSLESLPDALLLQIMGYFVCPLDIQIESFLQIQIISRRFHLLANSQNLWIHIPMIKPVDKSLNLNSFKFIALKNSGTEGKCYQAYSRKLQKSFAIKRARVYPDHEGIPYYMMREMAALKKISHKNICPLEMIHLNKFKLYLFFPYVEISLCDLLPNKDIDELDDRHRMLNPSHIQDIFGQLLQAVNYCHSRGIIHRNIKPKHLLIVPGPNPQDILQGCTLQLADFALARILDHPPHPYTSEVITLWYRPPEILMGQKNYTAAVDIWSCGCIFAEMLQGKPLFLGLCEIDQLLQIFFKLGVPNTQVITS